MEDLESARTVKYPRLKTGGLDWGGITPVSPSLDLTSLSQGHFGGYRATLPQKI